jgi:hypothetical protein
MMILSINATGMVILPSALRSRTSWKGEGNITLFWTLKPDRKQDKKRAQTGITGSQT